MTSTDMLAAAAAVTGAIAACTMWSRLQARKEKQEQKHTRQTELQEHAKVEAAREETIQAACKVLQARAAAHQERRALQEAPCRTTAADGMPADAAGCPGAARESSLAGQAVQHGYCSRVWREEKVTYADGAYIVNGMHCDEGEVVLELRQGSTIVKGYLSALDKNDFRAFISSLARHDLGDELPFSLDLQANVLHTKSRLQHAVILGEGAPREGKRCLSLDSILQPA